ncbi:hypothetical protein P0W64_08145 [Tsukamurella sp. 8F]|uniref:hypothetical protein n=1 Tax=unclassified Tsukamurella TaxID=2633480 RepID=UPI0023B9185A|nr:MULTISPECIES: hypothetical protein [unclassified Tsukamurella]MDF0528903.1 hypothetical protein [Tsukamurella sp. 8J]MDF0586738.1 hypothetical protein [Tsukamurella sp. 8F]
MTSRTCAIRGAIGGIVVISAFTALASPAAAAAPDAPGLYRHTNGNYAFVSPSGSFHCGIATTFGPMAGCTGELPASLPQSVPFRPNEVFGGNRWTDCGPNGYVAVESTGPYASCTTQPLWTTDSQLRVLPYGHSLSANGFTCRSEQAGVTCRHDDSGHAVTASRRKVVGR